MRHTLKYGIPPIALVALLWAGLASATDTTKKDNVIIFRCVDAKGKVSLQDSPCAKSSTQETREMQRPKDAPALKKMPDAKPVQAIPAQPPVQNLIASLSPPDLYQCTNYEGKTRDSESYDPNPRCEPVWAQRWSGTAPIEIISSCTWVKDSCVRYQASVLCDRWKAKQKQAQSDLRYAFSDTLAYRKSELTRITQIVRNSCQ